MLTLNFTDAYGITHTDAIVVITDFNSNSNESFDEMGVTLNSNGNVNYSYQYWTTQAAKDSGASALTGFGSIDTVALPQGVLTNHAWCEADLTAKLT